MWYKNITGRFFGLVTKHACSRRTDGQNYDSQDRANSCVARQKPFILLGLGAEHRSRIRYLSKKKFANLNEFPKIKKFVKIRTKIR